MSQVVEQLEKELPKNTETEMGPIATGLGEIYHYTIRAKEDTSINTRSPSSEPCRTGLCANSFPEPLALLR